MKKHFSSYLHGILHVKELRMQLLEEGNSYREVKKIIDAYHARINQLMDHCS
jgi:hypothetical protein